MRNRNTIEYLGVWETLYNPDFKPLEFEGFKTKAGLNAFTLSPMKWINATNAIGIVVKSGRYGGTYAHKDIAFKFASWISVEFELYLYKEFQRLKAEEQKQIGWTAKRELTKLNYRIHTDAIKHNLIPPELDSRRAALVYADEADVLNVAMFGITAREWREANPNEEGNIRDYATTIELAILSNLEFMNGELITNKIDQQERLMLLNKEANREKELFNSNNEKQMKRIAALDRVP